MFLTHVSPLLPPGPREGCDRHRPPPPPEPHRHLQRGRSAEALEALMCCPETEMDVLPQQLLSSLWTLLCPLCFVFGILQHRVAVNKSLWTWGFGIHDVNNTIGFTYSAACFNFLLKPPSWVLVTDGSVCTVEPYLPEPVSLRNCSQFVQQRNY